MIATTLALASSVGLVHVLVVLIVVGLLYWVFTLIPLPPPAKQIGNVIFVIVCVLILLNFVLGLIGEPFLPL